MNSFVKYMVVCAFMACTTTSAMDRSITNKTLVVGCEIPHNNKNMHLLHNENDGFSIVDTNSGEIHAIKQYNLHRELRDINNNKLRILALECHFKAEQDGTGDYHLMHYPRLKGGGPATAWAFQNITRCVMWAIPTALTIHLAKRGLDAVCDKVPGAKNATQGGAYTASFGGVTNVIDTNMGGGALPKPTNAQTFMQGSATTGAYYVVEQMHNNPATKDFIEKAEAVAPVTVGLTASTTASSVATAATKVVTGYSAIVESVAGIAYAIGMWLPYTP